MAAFDIIGVDFQCWLGVDFGVARQHQVVIAELRIAALRILVDQDVAVKDRAAPAIENSLELFAAAAIGCAMFHRQVEVR